MATRQDPGANVLNGQGYKFWHWPVPCCHCLQMSYAWCVSCQRPVCYGCDATHKHQCPPPDVAQEQPALTHMHKE
jgi:hypothetical protein